MDHLYMSFWIGAYLVIGATLYLLDVKWGVPSRRFLINLMSKKPREIQQGFIVGRRRRVMFAWCLGISYGLSAIMILTGNIAWHFETAFAILEAIVCLIGMHLGPAFGWFLKAFGTSLDKMDELEASIKSTDGSIIDKAMDKGKEVTEVVREKLTAAESETPEVAQEESRQAKIDKMDEILGKQRSQDE